MANSKQSFLGLVKIVGTQTSAYDSLEKSGKLVFAHLWDSESEGVKVNERFIINANGVEYKIATEDVFKALEARVSSLESWKTVVDSSITTLDSSVSALETWRTHIDDVSVDKLDASVKNHENRIDALEEASTALGDRIANVSQNVIDISTYVHTTVNTSIDDLQAKDIEIDGSINDISSRLASVAITAADNSIYVNGTSIAVEGDNYVDLTTANNKLSAAIKDSALTKGTGTGAGDVSLATKGYVDEQVAVLEQALVFKGNITSTADASSKLTDAAVEAGYTYVATAAGAYNGQSFESGDLIIVKADSAAGADANIIVVERNLDGAVTAAAGLTDDYVILGSGNQTVKVSSIEVNALTTAIANANSAIQSVNANSSTATFVEVQATTDTSIVNISVGAKTHDVSTATSDAENGLATAKATKEYVDAQIAAHKVDNVTLDSSTPLYVETSATVSADGQTISASVGVITATLADASNGSTGLAMAEDVYAELSKVEEVTATSITTMAGSLGLGDALEPNWSEGSGIGETSTYREVIEELHGQVGSNVVNSIGGAHGDISIDSAVGTDGSVAFTMDVSTLKGTVTGWAELKGRVSAAETSIGEVSTRLSETSTRLSEVSAGLNDLSTYVRQTVDASIDALQAKDVEIDSSIDRLDASVSALETELDTYKVKTITGEAGISARANDDYVAVSASQPDANGNVTLDASVQLAEDVTLPSGQTHEAATGLATDGWVKDYLAWEVISD